MLNCTSPINLFVIILNWNGKEDTLSCIASMKDVSTPHHLIIVDNGSTDGSIEAIKQEFPKTTIIETGENLGYAGGNNVGIQYALEREASHILILNNDTLVEPSFLDAFLKQGGDILGAKTLLYDKPTQLDHLGGKWNPKRGQFDLVGHFDDEKKWTFPWQLDYVCGCAMFVKADVFKKIGLFDSRFFLFWEETDWCARAIKAGYQPTFCPKAKIAHKVSASFVGGQPHKRYFWWRNRLLWVQKNCTKKEKRGLYLRVIIPQVAHMLKLYPLKTLQLFLLKCFRPNEDLHKRKEKLSVYKASLVGVKDYFLRRFGNGPAWIFKRPSQK